MIAAVLAHGGLVGLLIEFGFVGVLLAVGGGIALVQRRRGRRD